MINSVTKYSCFPCKILQRQLPSEGRGRGRGSGRCNSHRADPVASGHHHTEAQMPLVFFLVIKLEHKKIDDYQKAILHNTVN